MSTTSPRTLAEQLRTSSDAELAVLLRNRPDLLTPPPSDVAALAARATTQTSVRRAMDRLDAFALQTLDVLAASPEPTGAAAVRDLLGADPHPALDRLRALGLVWGPDDALHLVRAVRSLLPEPAGLGPSAATALTSYGPSRLAGLLADLALPGTGDPVAAARQVGELLSRGQDVAALLEGAPAEARAVLERLTWGPPVGRVADAHRDVRVSTARTPVDWLLARGLLVATEEGSVVLPREVGVWLRGGRVHAQVRASPPELVSTRHELALVQRTAAAAAAATVRAVGDLLEAWGYDAPGVLRSGGLGVRDLRRAGAQVDRDEASTAVLLEVALATGLLARDQEQQVWRPTGAFDTWVTRPMARRWVELVRAWLASDRVAALVGERDERGRTLSALGPGLPRPAAPGLRRATLDLLAEAAPGAAPRPRAVHAVLEWRAPHRGGRAREDLVDATLREAEQLGLTGLGALAGHARALLDGDEQAAVARLGALLPAPVDHVLLQADLTAVAPGPLTPDLARELSLLAEVESTGGATVYRFTEASLRRALDAGRSGTDMHAFLAAVSRTPVPQPLGYLVDDVARRHGRLRVGVSAAYLRCDDEAMLTELLSDRRAGALGLRRLAPTVLVSTVAPEVLLERLRALGHAPAAESADGVALLAHPDARRAPEPARLPVSSGPSEPSAAVVAATVRAIRSADRAPGRGPAQAGGVGLVPTNPIEALAMLRSAVRTGSSVWIGYADNEGVSRTRLVDPVRVDGGQLSGFDHLRQRVRGFAVHRITAIAPAQPEVGEATPAASPAASPGASPAASPVEPGSADAG